MVKLYLSAPQPHTHFLEVQLHIEDVYEDGLELQLATWRPGRYEVQHYARYIRSLSVHGSNDELLHFRKINQNRWWVESAQVKSVVVKYSFYANQPDAGGSYIDEERWFLNPINFALAVVGREKEGYEVIIDVPSNFNIATPLMELAHGRYKATDYEQLVDSPLLIATTLLTDIYIVDHVRFHVVFWGDVVPAWNGILDDFKAFTQAQFKLFGGFFPIKEYYFLIQILPFKIYHGVEHLACTALVIGPDTDFLKDEFYAELLGLASHELFHVWNVKTIRPNELLPYNYASPQYFQTCFVAEGVTTYYGDLMLVRSKVFDKERYLKELTTIIEQHTHHFGRLYASLAESSFDLWVDGYVKQGVAPNRSVSVYTEGCLAAWLLDWYIRTKTNFRRSLDDLMQILLTDYAQKGIGYTINDYINIASKLTKEDASWYLEKYIFGKESLLNALQSYMPTFGLVLKETDNELYSQLYFGFKFEAIDDKYIITAIHPHSPAYHTLVVGDQIIQINENPASKAIEAWLEIGKDNELVIIRNYKRKKVSIWADGHAKYFVNYTLCANPDAEQEEIMNQTYWLTGTKPEL